MSGHCTLLMTDMADSTRLNEQLGDERMRALWQAHDATARDLLRQWQGREIGRSDGFLLLFEQPLQALGFAQAYHRALSELSPPPRARIGLHHGPVTLRENPPEARALGATPFDIDGLALPTAARVAALAQGGQTLLTGAVLRAVPAPPNGRVESHGHWRLKGLAEPLELFEHGTADTAFAPPSDSAKAYRVVRRNGSWSPVRELPHNLPAERDPLVGRQAALDALARAFDEGARLVTLLGMGGIGKTRLALNHARGWLGDYPGGAWFCDLNAALSLDGVVHAVAQGLQVAAGAGDPVAQLGAAIAGRGPCLIVLDNFEQVARHAEATLGVWLERAPEARFIATSREVLGIVGERTLVLAPLLAEEAAEMFRQRLRAAGQASALAPADEAALPALMDLLDRLPLAIELAAARARVMPPRQLLERMGERFKLLAARGGRHDRQTTMRATLDWSWNLLAADEQAVLAQLSVFEGGCDAAAAEAVAGPVVLQQAWVLDVLQALAEKSLLRTSGDGRFDLLRTVRDYATERLAESGGTAAAERRHWRYFAGLSEAQAAAHRGVEVENLVLGCRRAATQVPAAETVAAVQLLGNAWAALRLTGPFKVALDLARLVAGALPADDPLQARVDCTVGTVSILLGDAAGARSRLLQAVARGERGGDARSAALARCQLAVLALSQGDPAPVRPWLDAVAASALAQSDPVVRYMHFTALGTWHLQRQDRGAARTCYLQALELAAQQGNGRWRASLHGNLGALARADGRAEAARGHWQTALDEAVALGDRQAVCNMKTNLGLLLLELGQAQAAAAELRVSLALARTIGHRHTEAIALCNLGLATEALGDAQGAIGHQRQAAEVAAALGDSSLAAQARGYAAVALAECGEHAQARLEIEAALLQAGAPATAPAALLLLQAALVQALAGAAPAARLGLAQAEAALAACPGPADPEVTALRVRVLAAFARRSPDGRAPRASSASG